MTAAESAPLPCAPEVLAEKRLLTEADHLLEARQRTGQYPPEALDEVRINLYTAVQELAMPYAVTTTFQRLEEATEANGRTRRMFMWLGKCAVEVAESGRLYHFSQPALDRVAVEVAEAQHSEEQLCYEHAQVFISPRMSRADAPEAVARQEHLATDDAVRVSFLETDRTGKVIGRRMESLLVRDIPLAAWTGMLQDPHNIFGKGFRLRDPDSAVSVMELFKELALPRAAVADGPVNLVAAVLPYIKDQAARGSVARQLERFRADQTAYRLKAEQTAEEWLAFEKELAESLYQGVATFAPQQLIATLQHQWSDTDLALIREHQQADGGYHMTRRLAAVLERAKRNLLAVRAAVVTGNEHVIGQLGVATAQAIFDSEKELQIRRANGAPVEDIMRRQAVLDRQVARQNVSVGGGCMGEQSNTFRSDQHGATGGTTSAESDSPADWKWQRGHCRNPQCRSPQPTEVGPCHICRNCQHEFDAGRDPTKAAPAEQEPAAADVFMRKLRLRWLGKQAAAKRRPEVLLPVAA
ncbi:MAG TPA: hypothetical protein VHC98_04190 [Candidatus Saccharimonadales bacterium]|nr:hypothetical protein [Candidatus Saccharimonadales bacterium]